MEPTHPVEKNQRKPHTKEKKTAQQNHVTKVTGPWEDPDQEGECRRRPLTSS